MAFSEDVSKDELDCCDEHLGHQEAIRQVEGKLPPQEQLQQAAELFKILGDATRVKILYILFLQEMCVCDIAALVQVSQSAVSHQLRLLRNSRLVRYRKEGKMAWYSLYDEHVARLIKQGITHVGHY
jgi:ArsR family transcriptional regulator, lead/cadmium/zinc/bismuth-responsive transcriptional repressor